MAAASINERLIHWASAGDGRGCLIGQKKKSAEPLGARQTFNSLCKCYPVWGSLLTSAQQQLRLLRQQQSCRQQQLQQQPAQRQQPQQQR